MRRLWAWLVKVFRHLLGLLGFGKPETRAGRRRTEKVQYRYISTKRWGLNMPKSQPCKYHFGLKKRFSKTMGGALYRCNHCHGAFFVQVAKAWR